MDQLLYAELGPNNGSIVLNLSEGGCSFQAITPIRNQELHFSFAIGGGQEIEGTGRVVWVEKTKKVGGMRFINLTAPLQEQIRSWLADPKAIDVSATVYSPVATMPGDPEAKARRKRLREEARLQWEAAQHHWEYPVPVERPIQAAADSFPSEADIRQPETAPELEALQAVPQESIRSPSAGLWRGVAAIVLAATLGSLMIAYHRQTGSALIWLGTMLGGRAEESRGVSPADAGKPSNGPPANLAVRTASETNTRLNSAPEGQEAGSRVPVTMSQPAAEALPVAGESDASEVSGQDQVPSENQAAGSSYSSKEVQTLWGRVESGDTGAEIALAERYARGDGVAKSCGQAKVLLDAAAKRGNPDAQRKREELSQTECP